MMSAPLAIGQTSKPNMNLQNKKLFQIASNNTNYSLSLSYNDKLILFEIEKEGEFPKQEYSLLVDLNQLNLINKYFSQFENFSEIQSSFETLIEMKKLNIKNDEKEKVIKINIINPMNKKEFSIDIPLKEKTLKNEIESIIPYIKSLNDKINKMENRIDLLENKVNELYSIKEEYTKLKEEKIEQNNLLFPKSSIIKKDEENLITSWLDKIPSKFNLLMGILLLHFTKNAKKKVQLFYFLKPLMEQDLEVTLPNFGMNLKRVILKIIKVFYFH